MRYSERVFSRAADLVESGVETYCCPAILVAALSCNLGPSVAVHHKHLFESWFRPPRKPSAMPWWAEADLESRILALCFMEHIAEEHNLNHLTEDAIW